MDNEAIDNYYHMTIMDEGKTCIVNIFSKSYGPLLYIYMYLRIINSLSQCTQHGKILIPYVYGVL